MIVVLVLVVVVIFQAQTRLPRIDYGIHGRSW
jgi:hypothetical protein